MTKYKCGHESFMTILDEGESMTKYKCEHESFMTILDENILSMAYWFQWYPMYMKEQNSEEKA